MESKRSDAMGIPSDRIIYEIEQLRDASDRVVYEIGRLRGIEADARAVVTYWQREPNSCSSLTLAAFLRRLAGRIKEIESGGK